MVTGVTSYQRSYPVGQKQVTGPPCPQGPGITEARAPGGGTHRGQRLSVCPPQSAAHIPNICSI